MSTVWREPCEETVGLYPKLVVHDERQSGSITLGRSRLPVWAFVADMVLYGWTAVEHSYGPTYGVTAEDITAFLYHLLDVRGDFARLLLTLADVERDDAERDKQTDGRSPAWWDHEPSRDRVIGALRACLAALESDVATR